MNYRGLAVFSTGVALSLAAGWLAFPRLLYESSKPPIPFSHRVHAEKAGSACADCHAIASDGRFGGIPKMETCAVCHGAPLGDTPEEKRMIDDYITPGREIPWPVYARQPDNVRFSHAMHVKIGKLDCERCHADHGKADALAPFESNRISGYSHDLMKMSVCEDCHREQHVEAGCLACHK